MIGTRYPGVKAWGRAARARLQGFSLARILPRLRVGLAALSILLPLFAGAAEGAGWAGGLYRSAELGLLDVRMEGGRVSGKYQGEGACPDFQVDQQIVEGQLEGNVLVGTVMLCQTGPACRQRAYPFLAFLNAADAALTADVRLDAGCASPGLKGSRLVLAVAPADSRGPDKEVAGPAAQVARAKGNAKRNAELARTAVVAGARLTDSGDYAGAAQQFEAAISYDERNWIAYEGLGTAEAKRGNVTKAIDAFERARDLAHDARQENADIFYNLACVVSRRGDKKEALGYLRQALRLGFALPDQMNADPDLNSLRDDPEFKKLVSQAAAQKAKGGRHGDRRP